jgi:acyl-CoA synthetase (AMP-forming)/AMP-acid ligase II/acyl carrier protein
VNQPAPSKPFTCIAELLAHHGCSTPNRAAILAPERKPMSYQSLWTCAQHTVRALRSIGIGRSDRVAVILPNGPEAAVALVSVATAAVCVPLDPRLTGEECRRYLAQTRVAALLTIPDAGSAGRAAAIAQGVTVLDLVITPRAAAGSFKLKAARTRGASEPDFAGADNDAFILLTSGTTSRPKAIPLTHAAVCLSARNVGAAIDLGAEDRLLSVLPLFHGHGLVSGVLAALGAGSSVVCTPGFDPAGFFRWLPKFNPTWYTAVPPIHRAVLEAAEKDKARARRSSLRLIRSASSTLPIKVIRGLERLFCVPVIDTFGMSEAATQIAANPMHRRKPGSVGVAAGAEITIVDAAGRRLSPGEHGEIALRGPTITRGYDNDDAATREAFRDGWFRTGDLGYLDKDGYLYLVGRVKEVINRGGQKVAPGEVEEALLAHPDVIEAAVFPVPHTRLGADVAAAVVLRANAQIRAHELRAFVHKRLASFKVPGLIRIVPQIPKAAGGKVKRVELAGALAVTTAAPDSQRHDKTASRSELEHEIAHLWAELLDFDHIDIDQDVFALGVDSIAIMDMILRLRERFAVDLAFADIFDAPTATALAARLQRSMRVFTPASSHADASVFEAIATETPHARKKSLPVAIVQERILRIERQMPSLPQFNVVYACRMRGSLNIAALRRGVAEIARRHDALRTRFAWRSGRPVAIATPSGKSRMLLNVRDLAVSMVAKNSRAKALLRRKAQLAAERESMKGFDVNRLPLFRVRLFRLGANDHVFLLVAHDLIIDGWSIGIFMQELMELYAASTADRDRRLPGSTPQFADFVRWQRRWCSSDAAAQQIAYWQKRLRKAVPLFGRTAATIEPRQHVAQEQVRVPSDVLARLAALSDGRGVTLFMTLLTAFKALLALRTGRNDICVATALANRSHPGTDRIIGPLSTTTIMRTRFDAELTFAEALDRVRETVLEAYARQELPFDVVAARLVKEGLDPAALTQAYFVLQPALYRSIGMPGMTIQPFGHLEREPGMVSSRNWLTMSLFQVPDGIRGVCSCNSKLAAGCSWADDFKTILAKAAANFDEPLSELPIL